MSEPEKEKLEFNPSTAIRAEGESDRPEELKVAREAFVDNINGFLDAIEQAQINGGTLSVQGGLAFPVGSEPRIKHSFLGRSANGRTNSVARSIEPGVALYGDGVTSSRIFEAVIPTEQGGWSTIVVEGSDPMLSKQEDGRVAYSVGKSRVVARIAVGTNNPSEDGVIETNEKYEVLGDGRVNVPIDPTGLGVPAMNRYAQRTQGMEIGSMVVQELGSSLTAL